MRSAMHHFAKYMASYTALMLIAYLLWQSSGCPAADAVLPAGTFEQCVFSLSNFLIGFAVVAYPLYALIEAAVKRIMGKAGRSSAAGNEASSLKKRAASH